MRVLKSAIAMLAAVPSLMPGYAFAATATGNLNVRITIQAECKVVTAADLDFGTRGVVDANIDQTTTISVQCTNSTPYSVGLNAGNGVAATVAVRKMTGPATATINYSIYQNAARTQIWGNTVATDTVAGTGNGAAQILTAYGRVPPQTTPGPGVYSDVVAITVTY